MEMLGSESVHVFDNLESHRLSLTSELFELEKFFYGICLLFSLPNSTIKTYLYTLSNLYDKLRVYFLPCGI